MTLDLDREIGVEEKRAGISDPNHFAYPTYARAAMSRRENLKSSIAELAGQMEEAKAAQEEAQVELQKFETLDGREKAAERNLEMGARA
jgi:flagellar FliJ protein